MPGSNPVNPIPPRPARDGRLAFLVALALAGLCAPPAAIAGRALEPSRVVPIHLAPASAPAPQVTTSLAATLQATLDGARDSYRVPGLSGAVILADGSRWDGSSGWAELGPPRRAATPDTPFVAGSITKTFVAVLIVQLAQEGRLSLDDRLSRWVSGYPNGNRILVRQLLNHTSGIYNYFEHRDYQRLVFKRPTHRWTVSEILRLSGKPYFPPGRGYHYSNTNYVLLGLIAERAGGSSLAAQIRRRFLAPLGLSETYFQGEEHVPTRVAMGYLYDGADRRFEGLADATNTRPNTSAATVAWAAGAMVSTAHDLATWTRALYGGDELQPAFLTQMLDFGRYGYGLGVRLASIAGQEAWGHGGSLRGFTATTWYLPGQELTVSVTTNRGRILPDLIAARLAQSVFEYLDHAAPVAVAPAESLVSGSVPRSDTVPVLVRWSAADDLSGVDVYELQRSTNGSTWVGSRLANPHAASSSQSLRAGNLYRFRVRARDRAGNVGDWASGPAFAVGVHIPEGTSAAAGGFRFAFFGEGVAWIAPRGSAGGRVAVYVDGVLRTSADLHAPTVRPATAVFATSWTASAIHEIELRPTPGSAPFTPDATAFAVLLRPSAPEPGRPARN